MNDMTSHLEEVEILPTAAELDFAANVADCIASFESIANRHERVEIADTIDLAIERFHKARRSGRLPVWFTPSQREQLLAGLVIARFGVEVHLAGQDRDRIVGALDSLSAMAIHFGRSKHLRTLQPADVADLTGHIKLGQNAARDVVLLADIESAARRRALPVFKKHGSGT